MKHISLRNNHIRECIHIKEKEILHISEKLNVLNIFIRELCDGAHFRALRNSFMCPRPRR